MHLFRLGYFNDDKKIDVMCINTVTGRKQIQLYTDRAFQVVYDVTTDWCKGTHYIARYVTTNWCKGTHYTARYCQYYNLG